MTFQQCQLLKEIKIDNQFNIIIEQGNISRCDIRIRYQKQVAQQKFSRKRTPKHIHWVVDVLIKRMRKKELTIQLIEEMQKVWAKIPHIKKRTEREKWLSNVEQNIKKKYWKKYKVLDSSGEYSSKFLIFLLQLLILQEKANNNNASFFPKLLELLKSPKFELWTIISKATHNGK